MFGKYVNRSFMIRSYLVCTHATQRFPAHKAMHTLFALSLACRLVLISWLSHATLRAAWSVLWLVTVPAIAAAHLMCYDRTVKIAQYTLPIWSQTLCRCAKRGIPTWSATSSCVYSQYNLEWRWFWKPGFWNWRDRSVTSIDKQLSVFAEQGNLH